MNKTSLITMGAVLSIGAAASADFVSFEGAVEEVGDFTVIKMHAVFSNNTDIALNLFEMENHADMTMLGVP